VDNIVSSLRTAVRNDDFYWLFFKSAKISPNKKAFIFQKVTETPCGQIGPVIRGGLLDGQTSHNVYKCPGASGLTGAKWLSCLTNISQMPEDGSDR
jgi:hypothetical protein